jgi:hypothetical protein
MRGRNNNNRKGPNPLTRNYESNGPDVKIRGSAQQIAEKYASLARDAQSSGDRVMAENYLQHAEHYNRIILAAQAQMPIQHMRDGRDNRDDFDDENEEEREEAGNTAESAEAPQPERRPRPQPNDGSGPQPVIEGMPAEVAMHQADSSGENGTEKITSQHQVNGHHLNGNGAEKAVEAAEAAEGDEAAEAPARRPRRPRRPRRVEISAESGPGSTGEEATSAPGVENGDVAAE